MEFENKNAFENHDFCVEFLYEVDLKLAKVANDPTYSIEDAQNFLRGWAECLVYNELISADDYVDIKIKMYEMIYEFENEKEN